MKWYFGDQIDISYRYSEDTPGTLVMVNGQKLKEENPHLDTLVKYLEELGLKRLDLAK